MKPTELEDKKSIFQEKSIKIFITLIAFLIGATPFFNELFLDFFPNLKEYQGWIKLSFIGVTFIIVGAIWWKEEKKKKDQNISEDEQLEKSIRKVKWITWQQNIFKYYPLNIVTLRIIPLFICWIISFFISKEHKSYLFHSFEFPKYWENYNYEEIISKFFKSMFRLYIERINKHYEIKFGRNFQNVEIRRSGDTRVFNKPENGLYEDIFSTHDLKHLKIFTWIFPLGLYWNLRRTLLKVKKKFFKN